MIHYHGTPIGGKREDVARFLRGRNAMIPFPRHEDIGTASEECESFVIDNGAFSFWNNGNAVTDWSDYYEFIREWYRHQAFAWCIIPDVIDGDEQDNDDLLAEWPFEETGVPVWHLHESLERLERLCMSFSRVALGSSGEFRDPGSEEWKERMNEAMERICDERNRPIAKLHGLRMLDIELFTQLPLASADSCNAAINGPRKATQCGCNNLTGMTIIADRIQSHQSAASFEGFKIVKQGDLLF